MYASQPYAVSLLDLYGIPTSIVAVSGKYPKPKRFQIPYCFWANHIVQFPNGPRANGSIPIWKKKKKFTASSSFLLLWGFFASPEKWHELWLADNTRSNADWNITRTMRNWSVILQMPRLKISVCRTPYSVLHNSVCYLFCLEWAFFYSHDSCARMVLGLLVSPFHGKLNLTSMNWPPAGPFLPLPLSCQGLNFTSMGHSGPRWIPLVGFGWFMVGLHSRLV